MSLDLRQTLRQTLSILHSEILTDGSQSVSVYQIRVCESEISSIWILLSVCQEALTGERLPPNPYSLSPGAVKDYHDLASCTARELMILREEVDSELLNCKDLPRESREIIQGTFKDEANITEEVEQIEKKHSQTLEQGISLCASEMCDALCKALSEAAPVGTSTQRREAIAIATVETLRSIAANWLEWHTNFESTKRVPGTLIVPPEIILACLQNVSTGTYIKALRRFMHLRRQQARLTAVLARFTAAIKVCDACVLLRQKIVFPPPHLIQDPQCTHTFQY